MLDWLNGFKDWLASFVAEALQWWFGLLLDTFFYLYDIFLDLFQTLITTFPLPAALANFDPWSGFSPQVMYLLFKFRVFEVLAILSAAWTIRFMLNRIPFLRL